jgi:hypothetical protein
MPELTPQEQAYGIASLSAWCLYESDFLKMLTEAKCSFNEARSLMNSEVN